MAEIPIFPLRTVLFPGGRLPLRIFEQRYLDMVRFCTSTDTGFGVCLIIDGKDETSALQTAQVGTLASIVDWYTMEDGLLGLMCEGTARFVLKDDWVKENGLLMGEVEWVPEPARITVPTEFDVLCQVLSRYMEKVSDHYPDFEPELLQDASWVSYRLAELLPIGGVEKQHVLELTDPIDRLQNLLEIIPRFQS